jgi:hypothetical protein
MQTFLQRFTCLLVSIGALVGIPLAPAIAGTFKNPPIISTGSDPAGIASADLNHDGKFDIVYLDGTSSHALHVLLGRGNGSFAHSQDIAMPVGICCTITVADVTGDGIPDLILSGHQQTTMELAVVVGNGDGTFQTPILTTFQPPNVSSFGLLSAPVIGDINGDGKMDVAVSDAGNQEVYILKGDNSGAFTLLAGFVTDTIGPIYLADLNGDSRLDLVVTDPIGATFLVYLGNGDGTFQPVVRYAGQSP